MTTRRTDYTMYRLNMNFWSKIRRGLDDECWLWTGQTNDGNAKWTEPRKNGHQRTVPAPKAVLEHKLGRVLGKGMVTLHSCDNGMCCNPNHLSEGSYSKNSQEIHERGRARVRAPIDPAMITAYRAEYNAGGTTYEKMAKKYNHRMGTLRHAIQGRKKFEGY